MATAPTNNLSATATGAERVPPHDLDAEMALLGSMMMSRDAIADVVPIIGRTQSAWFYLPAHQQLFEVLLDQYDDPTKAIDLIVVSDELRRRSLLEAIGGHEYMIQLAESFGEWSNAEYYAKIVRDKGMLRDLIRCSGEMAERAYSDIDDVREILDRAEELHGLGEVSRNARTAILYEEGKFELADPVSDYLPQFQDMKVYVSGTVDSDGGNAVLWSDVETLFYGSVLGRGGDLGGDGGRVEVSGYWNLLYRGLVNVGAVLILLTQSWLPIGPEKGLWRNAILVGGTIGALLLVFQLFQAAYPFVLRWALDHKATFLMLPAMIVVAGGMVWRGFDDLFSWMPSTM
ncbi:MAG: hypothetical protein IH989_05425, partial [Planctomycetes bacterium]|nr:hypothetical protein [Planctomycetota bacterium]